MLVTDDSSDRILGVRENLVRLTEIDTSMNYAYVDRAFSGFFGKVSPSVLAVPSMISVAEKRMLHGLAKRYYRGEGLIVDAGIFLGASTRCLGEGLKSNIRLRTAKKLKPQPIVSFEKGVVTPTMPAFFQRNGIEFDIPVGGNFLPLVAANIAPVQDLVELREGDIMQDERPLDYPIELCFLDILKLPQISMYCIKRFFSRLIPNQSIVLQQDYFYEKLPYIKTHQEYLRDHFDYIGEIGSTAIFRCSSAIPQDKLKALSTIGADEQLALADIAAQRSKDRSRRFLMELSKIRLMAKLYGKTAAERQLDFIRAEYSEQAADTVPRRIADAWRDIESFCKSRGSRPQGIRKIS